MMSLGKIGKSTLKRSFYYLRNNLFPRPNTLDRARRTSGRLIQPRIRLPPRVHRVRHRGLRVRFKAQ